MSSRRFFTLLLFLFYLPLTTCQSAPQSASQAPQSVTDETIRAKLWESYLYDAVDDIGNLILPLLNRRNRRCLLCTTS